VSSSGYDIATAFVKSRPSSTFVSTESPFLTGTATSGSFYTGNRGYFLTGKSG